MYNPMNLEGKRILITGASSGIGAACARTASRLGAHVIMVARNIERLRNVQKELFNPVESRLFCADFANFSGGGGGHR